MISGTADTPLSLDVLFELDVGLREIRQADLYRQGRRLTFN